MPIDKALSALPTIIGNCIPLLPSHWSFPRLLETVDHGLGGHPRGDLDRESMQQEQVHASRWASEVDTTTADVPASGLHRAWNL